MMSTISSLLFTKTRNRYDNKVTNLVLSLFFILTNQVMVSFSHKVGNAVPPPMAAAIGREIKKCVIATLKKQNGQDNKEEKKPDVKEDVKKEEDAVKKEESKDEDVKEEEDTKMES